MLVAEFSILTSCRRNRFAVGLVFVLLVATGAAHGEDANKPRTDLYGDPLPSGAIARLGTIRLRHADAEIAFSKDGKRLFSCDGSGEIRIWDVATGKLLRRQQLFGKPRQAEEAHLLAVSTDGKIAAIREKAICVYDIYTAKAKGRLASTSAAHPDVLMKFSPDGKLLAMQRSAKDGAAVTEIWDTDAIKKNQTLAMPSGVKLSSVAFTYDGKRMAGLATKIDLSEQLVGYHVDLFLWDMSTGKLLRTRKGLRRVDCGDMAFSPDGKTLALGGRGEGAIRFLAADTLEDRSKRIVPAVLGSTDSVFAPTFSADGRWLAAAGRHSSVVEGTVLWGFPGDVLLWDLAQTKEPRRLPALDGFPLTFSADGKTLACRDEGQIRLYNAASARLLHHRPGHDLSGVMLAASSDGKIVASCGESGVLRLWDTATSMQLWKLEGKDHFFLSADGKRVVTNFWVEPFSLQVWEVAREKPLGRSIEGADKNDRFVLETATISPYGKRLAEVVTPIDDAACQLVVWDLDTGKRVLRRTCKLRPQPKGDSRLPEALPVLSRDIEGVTAWLGDRWGIEDVSSGTLLAKLSRKVQEPLAFSPDGRMLLARIEAVKDDGPKGESVEVCSSIEAASGQEIVRLEWKTPNQVVFTPDARGLIVSDHKNLSVWDTIAGEKMYEMAWPESIVRAKNLDDTGYVPFLASLPGGHVAASMAEGDILVWDLQPSRWPKLKGKRTLERKELAALWCDLTKDARTAYRTIGKLSAAPAPTVAFLHEHFRPTLDGKRIAKLVADLDSDAYSTRETASRELKRMPYRAEPMLRWALQHKPSLELRRRIEPILAEPRFPSTEDLRALRAITVLERIGTPEARGILEKLAGGAVSPETRAAQQALQRLKYR
ncbi:MAG TPA: WD40 repeat domain-containing protein [Gemmataceae bacterium]|nr:WD40 repeat domain-containing protein [Gemmataceae bacterium]